MKKIVVLVLLSISVSALRAQFVYDYLKAADAYFQKEDYSSAAEYYEKYFNENPALTEEEFSPYTPQAGSKKKTVDPVNKEQSMYKLAESYRMLNYPAKAAPYYKKVLDMKKKEFIVLLKMKMRRKEFFTLWIGSKKQVKIPIF